MPDRKEIKTSIRSIMPTHWSNAALATLLAGLIRFATSLPASLFSLNSARGLFFALAISLILSILYTIISAGFLQYFLHLLRGERASVRDLFEPLKKKPDRFLLVGILQHLILLGFFVPLIVLAGKSSQDRAFLPPFLGWLLLGGILCVCLALRYAFALPLLLDSEELSPIGAMKKSSRLLKGQKGRLLLLFLSFLGWLVPALLSGGLALLLIIPYETASVMQFYRRLLSKELPVRNEDHPAAEETSTQP